MFSNLTQNSILYILDINNSPKVLTGFVERVSPPRPKYNNLNPNLEMVVDIIATINGEKREFKSVPNIALANFNDFVLAESKDVLYAYVNSMLQNSKNIVSNIEKHQSLITNCELALEELNPTNKSDNKAMQDLQTQVNTLQESMKILIEKLNKESTN